MGGLSGILGGMCYLAMVRVGDGLEEEVRRDLGRQSGYVEEWEKWCWVSAPW